MLLNINRLSTEHMRNSMYYTSAVPRRRSASGRRRQGALELAVNEFLKDPSPETARELVDLLHVYTYLITGKLCSTVYSSIQSNVSIQLDERIEDPNTPFRSAEEYFLVTNCIRMIISFECMDAFPSTMLPTIVHLIKNAAYHLSQDCIKEFTYMIRHFCRCFYGRQIDEASADVIAESIISLTFLPHADERYCYTFNALLVGMLDEHINAITKVADFLMLRCTSEKRYSSYLANMILNIIDAAANYSFSIGDEMCISFSRILVDSIKPKTNAELHQYRVIRFLDQLIIHMYDGRRSAFRLAKLLAKKFLDQLSSENLAEVSSFCDSAVSFKLPTNLSGESSRRDIWRNKSVPVPDTVVNHTTGPKPRFEVEVDSTKFTVNKVEEVFKSREPDLVLSDTLLFALAEHAIKYRDYSKVQLIDSLTKEYHDFNLKSQALQYFESVALHVLEFQSDILIILTRYSCQGDMKLRREAILAIKSIIEADRFTAKASAGVVFKVQRTNSAINQALMEALSADNVRNVHKMQLFVFELIAMKALDTVLAITKGNCALISPYAFAPILQILIKGGGNVLNTAVRLLIIMVPLHISYLTPSDIMSIYYAAQLQFNFCNRLESLYLLEDFIKQLEQYHPAVTPTLNTYCNRMFHEVALSTELDIWRSQLYLSAMRLINTPTATICYLIPQIVEKCTEFEVLLLSNSQYHSNEQILYYVDEPTIVFLINEQIAANRTASPHLIKHGFKFLVKNAFEMNDLHSLSSIEFLVAENVVEHISVFPEIVAMCFSAEQSVSYRALSLLEFMSIKYPTEAFYSFPKGVCLLGPTKHSTQLFPEVWHCWKKCRPPGTPVPELLRLLSKQKEYSNFIRGVISSGASNLRVDINEFAEFLNI